MALICPGELASYKGTGPGPGGFESTAGWWPCRDLSPGTRAGRSQRVRLVSQVSDGFPMLPGGNLSLSGSKGTLVLILSNALLH